MRVGRKLGVVSIQSLCRPTKESEALWLFDTTPAWKDHWWGMPEFVMGDATPQHRLTVNFLTIEDVREFARRLGIAVGSKSDSIWFPPQELDEPKEWAYVED